MSSPSKTQKKIDPVLTKPVPTVEPEKSTPAKTQKPAEKLQNSIESKPLTENKKVPQPLSDNKTLSQPSPAKLGVSSNLLGTELVSAVLQKPPTPIPDSDKTARQRSNKISQSLEAESSKNIFQERDLPSNSTFSYSKSPIKGREPLKNVKEMKSPQKVLQKQGTFKNSLSVEDIDGKIKARRRVLEILENQTVLIDEENLLQIQSRDLLIEELTKEVIEAKSAIKEKKLEHEEVIKLKTLDRRVADLEKEKTILIQEYSDLLEMKQIDQLSHVNEKEEFEKLLESFNEENNLIRTQLKSKEEENAAMLEDIKKLSDIIKQFKNLNSDLNEKIEKLNGDSESLKVRYYESEVKAASLGELEGSLNDYIRAHKNSEKRESDTRDKIKILTLAYEDLQAFCMFLSEKIGDVLDALPDDVPGSLMLRELSNGLKSKKFVEIEQKVKKDKNNEKVKLLELSEKLEKNERELRIMENQQKPLNDQIHGLKELIEAIKKDHKSNLENLNLTMKTLQDHNEALKSEIQTLRVDSGRKEVKISAQASKIISLESIQLKTDEKIKKILDSKSLFEKENIELKEKLKFQTKQLTEKTAELKKTTSQNLSLAANVQALHEEFWKKDNILLKNKRAVAKLEKHILALTKTKLDLPKAEEGSEKLLKELYERDQKIEVLKDMIKSLKLKEKQKDRNLSVEISAELYPERFEKSEKELLNSLVAKVLNKFFGICSVNKSAVENSPDIPRMIKKLRQDLRMYSVFSTRDLQLTVSMLQQPLAECKSHLNLEELIAIVSKVAYAL